MGRRTRTVGVTRRLATAAALALALAAAGCAQERSPQAYCDAFWDKAIPLHEQYTKASENVENDPFTALMNLFSSPRDLAGMFDSMAQAAPEEIRSDTEAVRDSFKKLADSLGDAVQNPFGAMMANLGNALSVFNAMNRVDAYMTRHCGTPAEAIAARS